MLNIIALLCTTGANTPHRDKGGKDIQLIY